MERFVARVQGRRSQSARLLKMTAADKVSRLKSFLKVNRGMTMEQLLAEETAMMSWDELDEYYWGNEGIVWKLKEGRLDADWNDDGGRLRRIVVRVGGAD